jgi:hypothetical protein
MDQISLEIVAVTLIQRSTREYVIWFGPDLPVCVDASRVGCAAQMPVCSARTGLGSGT